MHPDSAFDQRLFNPGEASGFPGARGARDMHDLGREDLIECVFIGVDGVPARGAGVALYAQPERGAGATCGRGNTRLGLENPRYPDGGHRALFHLHCLDWMFALSSLRAACWVASNIACIDSRCRRTR